LETIPRELQAPPTGRKVEQGWCGAFDGVFPVWLGYDFGVPVTIDQVNIGVGLWANRAPLTWEVQASDDGTNYTTIIPLRLTDGYQ
jgi:hypothetical protein